MGVKFLQSVVEILEERDILENHGINGRMKLKEE
jgi:hypothetical protein